MPTGPVDSSLRKKLGLARRIDSPAQACGQCLAPSGKEGEALDSLGLLRTFDEVAVSG